MKIKIVKCLDNTNPAIQNERRKVKAMYKISTLLNKNENGIFKEINKITTTTATNK
jgi:hypothetical protein